MLVNIGNMLINTDNITIVTEEHGRAVVRFVSGVPERVTLSVNLESFTKYLDEKGFTIYG